jgi:hypothetical protein
MKMNFQETKAIHPYAITFVISHPIPRLGKGGFGASSRDGITNWTDFALHQNVRSI